MRLEQRKVLITGGGSGIGLALARALAPTNHVVIAGRDVPKLERVKADLPAVHILRLDVTSEAEAQTALAWMVDRFGGIDLLVNSAGVLHGRAFASTAEAAMDEEVAVNLLGSARMTRLALPMLCQSDDGAIVFLSSAVALGASPGAAVYAATKAAIHSLARSLRAELRDEIKVFTILPPWVDTELAGGFGHTRMPPARVAGEIVRALRRDQFETYIGRIKALGIISRLAPALADGILARELIGAPANRVAAERPVAGGPPDAHGRSRKG